jgi:hypothetical protein
MILISDAAASGIKNHYETTLARVQDYYELEMNIEKFTKMMNKLNIARHTRTLDLRLTGVQTDSRQFHKRVWIVGL